MTTTQQTSSRGRPSGFEPMLKVPEAARILGTGRGSVYGLVERGDLRSVRVGSLIRIPESALREFIDAGGRKAAEQ